MGDDPPMSWRRYTGWRGILTFVLIGAAIAVVAVRSRADFFSTEYVLCLGRAGTGTTVTRAEMRMCECHASRALGVVPFKAMAPRWTGLLRPADWARIRAAQLSCPKAGK